MSQIFYSGIGSTKVLPRKQKPLPPFDQPNDGNDVHTTPPPELDLNKLDIRADFNGITINLSRWNIDAPAPGRTLLDMVGANSTPPNMLMSPMMIMYPRKIQDAHITETLERNYNFYVVAPDGWNMPENGYVPTAPKLIDWAQYLQSWGLKILYWNGRCQTGDMTLQAMVNNHAVDFIIPGKEVDQQTIAEQFERVLDDTLSMVANDIPVGAHFSSNYPLGFPRDTFLTDWSKYDGRVHLMWQAHPYELAGTQAAKLYYARERVALGLHGGNGQLALKSKVYLYEMMATAQLYGKATEEYGCLRTLEGLYSTRRDSRIPALAGFCNGCRREDGMWI